MNLVGIYTFTYCKYSYLLCWASALVVLWQCSVLWPRQVCLVSLHSLLHCPAAAATLEGSAGILSGARSWERFAGGVVGGVRPLWLPGGVCCVVVAGQR